MPVFLNNVDDYLGPSQACVNPLFTAPSNSTQANTSSAKDVTHLDDSTTKTDESQGKESDLTTKGGVVQSRRRERQRPRIIQAEEDSPQRKEPIRLLHNTHDGLVKSETNTIDMNTQSSKKKKATVSLSDCLSCSGCVTSAEAVLMSHHSVDKLREVALAQQSAIEGKRIVLTISPAALADLYRHVYIDCGNEVKDIPSSNPSRRDFLQSIANFLKSEFGVEMMIDGAATQKISLLESAHEFCHRYRQQQLQKERQVVSAVSNCETTSIALSSTQTRYIKKKTTANRSMVLSSSNADDDTTMDVTVVDHPPGLVLESDDDCKSAPVQNEQNSNRVHTHNQTTALPVLASSCPGFVCLVEKTAAPVVPLLSSSKSPMSVAGTLLKSGILTRGDNSSTNHIIGERQLFHVAVMPCHDKKLEAGRNDFSWERQTLLKYTSAINGKSETTYNGNNNSKDVVNEVDLVLTTGELLEILTTAAEKPVADASSNSKSGRSIQDFLISLQSAADSTTSQPPCLLLTDLDLCEQGVLDNSVSEGEKSSTLLEVDLGVHGSGSYADFIFRYAAKDLFGCELPPNKPLPWKGASSSSAKCSAEVQSSGVIRRRPRRQDTTDLRSITLYKHSDGLYSCNKTESGCDKPAPVLNFATAYGFKNVQLILQSLSKEGYTAGALDAKGYDYVEVMACPSGCPNGGGQIGAMGQRETPKETKERVKRTVSLIPVLRPHNEKRSFASSLYGLHDDAIDDASHLDKFKLEDGCFGKIARRLLHTRFHVVPKLELSTGATAGVAISDTKW